MIRSCECTIKVNALAKSQHSKRAAQQLLAEISRIVLDGCFNVLHGRYSYMGLIGAG